MTAQEIKSEIKKLLDSVPEDALQELLQYLQEAQKHSKDQKQMGLYLRKIMQEDKELLDKLAK
ncbi:MAG: hypothetical protein ABR572_10335 [Cryomorphaceae bacterium]|nr:hypothetical protein [Flavobacteriales bacterium]